MRVLLIEDDVKLASFILKGLEESGFTIDHALDGDTGLHSALTQSYDLLIVDIMLPKKDGLSLIVELRKEKPIIPILILSAKNSIEERVKGLQIGSDDYLTKPFAFLELLARIQALIRRSTHCPSSHRLEVGELILDRLSYEVKRGNKRIFLKPKEFDILEYLMQHAGEVVTRTMLMDHVWNFQFDTSTNIVDVHVCHLRDKIDKGFDHKMINTIRGIGYILRDS